MIPAHQVPDQVNLVAASLSGDLKMITCMVCLMLGSGFTGHEWASSYSILSTTDEKYLQHSW
jgi:hypothetical protein